VGFGSLAAAGAAFAAGFICYASLPPGAGPVDPATGELGSVALARTTVASSTIAKPISGRASFSERFAFERPDTSVQVAQAPQISASFSNRFYGEELASAAPVRSSVAPPRTTVARASIPTPKPRAPARPAVAEAAPKPAAKAGFQLASAVDTVLALGYAPADTATSSGVTGSLKELDSNPLADADTRHTAIYDITSHTVYLPNGRRLEAHSGLGRHMDDPRSASIRMNGVTPPNVYDLRMRESLFHGVRALRLIPKDQSKMHGRSGILAHTYMLGPNGQSNGCVSFNNYPAFLEAYERGDITRLVVVEHLDDVPSAKTAADWFSNKLKDIFSRS
jgi:hypothetical protein